ncbi:hypothetical protein N7524_011058 [Penicillium chrysogenum]|nr:hypothetical protein N7524_011058 [Penicillium chrysogenum]
MSSQGLHCDGVNNGPKATTGGPNPTSESSKSSQRARSQRDALVALNDVIRKLILEQNEIENEIIRQRVVQCESGHNDQGKQKTCLYQDRHLAKVNDRAHCTGSLSITKTTQGRVKVTGPLRIPFDALFDRAPTIPAERGVLADQVARLSSTEENIQTFQVWENMATGFGLPSKK